VRPSSRSVHGPSFGRRPAGQPGDTFGSGYPGPARSRLGLWLRYAAMRAKVRLAYRGDFALHALGDLLVAGIAIVFLVSLFSHIPHIRGWSFPEILFLWGMGEVSTGLFFVLFQGLWALNQQYLLRGEMDRVLLRPLDPYGQIMVDHLNLEDLPIVLLGLAMIGWALPGLPAFSLAQWLLLPLFLLCGVLVLAGTLTLFSCLGFLIHHRGTAIGVVYQASAFNRYPLDIFPRPLQRLLTFVLPFAFIAFFPASWYLGRTEWLLGAAVQPLVGVGLFVGARWLWGRALRRYRSPGS